MSIFKKISINNIQSDASSSVIVFLVAVPLCLGIALASGAPLFSGIISGIIGGILVGILSGSMVGVSGPAAGLSIIVLGAIQDLGSFSIFLTAVVISGILQILMGIIRAGIIGYYFPSSVIKGMLSAIGIIIVLKQVPHAVGYDFDPEGDLEFVQPDGENTFSELFHMLDSVNLGAVIIFTISLLTLMLWEQQFIKKRKIFQLIQGPLVAVTLGILINQIFSGSSLYLDTSHLVNLPLITSFLDIADHLTFFDPSVFFNKEVLIMGGIIAVVASLETLLSVEATDKLDTYKRFTPTNRELIAQGVGNVCSGLIGGLPVTQVIVRSSANIQSGNKTKLSAILHGFLLLFSVLFIPHILNMIPLSCLAAILIVVGYKLAKPKIFIDLYRSSMSEFIPFIVTVVGIVFSDLLIGVLLGLAVGIFEILYTNAKKPYQLTTAKSDKGDPYLHIELAENLTFLSKAGMIKTISHIPDNTRVLINLSRSHFIHPDIYEILNDFKKNAKFRHIELNIIGLNTVHESSLKQLKEVYKIHN